MSPNMEILPLKTQATRYGIILRLHFFKWQYLGLFSVSSTHETCHSPLWLHPPVSTWRTCQTEAPHKFTWLHRELWTRTERMHNGDRTGPALRLSTVTAKILNTRLVYDRDWPISKCQQSQHLQNDRTPKFLVPNIQTLVVEIGWNCLCRKTAFRWYTSE